MIVEPDSTISTRASRSVARTAEPLTSKASTPSSVAPSSVGSTLNVPLVIGDVLSSVIDDVFNVFSSRSTVGTTSSVLMSRIGAVVLIFVSLATVMLTPIDLPSIDPSGDSGKTKQQQLQEMVCLW